MLWRPGRLFEGRAAVIVAGGASFTAAQARLIGMSRARDAIRVIAVNDAVYPCWFADVLYACDAKWWRYHGGVQGFPGAKVRLCVPTEIGGDSNFVGFPDVHHLVMTGREGFDPDPTALRSGENGGYQALHLSAHLGPPRAILVGFDMVGPHWFGRHPRQAFGDPSPDKDRKMAVWGKRVCALARELASLGMTVVNASGGRLEMQHVDLAEELARIEEAAARRQAPA